MKGTDFSRESGWAILPSDFDNLSRAWAEFSRGGLDTEAMVLRMNTVKADRPPYDVVDGVAVVSVNGPLSKRYSFFSMFMGGGSMQGIAHAVKTAVDDPEVDAILLDIDSPGGTVSGTEALAQVIRQANDQKPVVAFANGCMCSAAYWVGSGAGAIMTEKTASVGSIGVLMVHHDYSEENKKYGVAVTYLTAGKYKAVGNDSEPLSSFARDVLQDKLDFLYSLFVEAVSQNRGVSTAQVLESMADGRVFIGSQALEAGLADHVGTRDDALELARSMADAGQNISRSVAVTADKTTEEGSMEKKEAVLVIGTTEELERSYPDLVKQVRQEGAQGVDIDTARLESAKAERDRILGLLGIQFGEESGAAFSKVVESGVTVEQFKAIAGVQSPKAKDKDKDAMLRAIQEAGASDPGAGNLPDLGDKDFMAMVEEYRAVHKVGKVDAMQAVIKKHPKAHADWVNRQQLN